MMTFAYLLGVAATVIGAFLLFLKRRGQQGGNGARYETSREGSFPFEWDFLTSELGARIFDPEDVDFVASETPRKFARQFRQERTALALDWLRAIRGEVNQSIRTHLRAARASSELKPADEINVWFEFLLFQIISGILYLVIWAYGPPRTAKLAGYSLGLAGQLRKASENVLPAGRQVAVELVDSKRKSQNRVAI